MSFTIYRAAIASYTALIEAHLFIIIGSEDVVSNKILLYYACKVIKKSRAALASICWMQCRKGVSRAGHLVFLMTEWERSWQFG